MSPSLLTLYKKLIEMIIDWGYLKKYFFICVWPTVSSLRVLLGFPVLYSKYLIFLGTTYLLRSKKFSDAASFELEGTGTEDDCNK